MSALADLSEEERYLFAIMQDQSGIDIAEFCWTDETAKDFVFRCWDYQYPWYRTRAKFQIDQCVAAGTLVLTGQGYVPIEDVQIGDEVWTHRNRWRKVTFAWDRGEQDVVLVKGFGHHGLTATADHKFLTQDGSFAALSEGARWGMPTSVTHDGVVPDMRPAYASGRQNWVRDTTTPDFLWLYGLYLAEGSTSSSFGKDGRINRVTFSVHEREVEYVGSVLDACGLRYNANRVSDEQCFNLVVNSQPLADWMREQGGVRSHGKRLAPWVMGLEEKDRQVVLDGYLYGDGWTGIGKQGEARLSFTTGSKALAYGVKILAASLGWFGSTSLRQRAAVEIDGRDVTGRESYVTDLRRDRQRAGLPILDGHAWGLVRSVEPAGRARVYDLEVEEDHSFVVEGVAVSNCARAIGKSVGIQMRAWAFAFTNPGEQMLITAPEMIHLDPVTKNIEDRIMSTRLSREFLKKSGTSGGITHRPFEAKFRNGSAIVGRIPQKDGKGVKGMHPKKLEMDEAQDYPEPGWVELGETLKYGEEDATWRSHGVSRGVRDRYYKQSQPESGWYVHRYCLPAGTLVYGVDGPFQIQDATPGTLVWSVAPDGRLEQRPVLARIENGEKATWEIAAKGGFGLETTPNHPFLVLARGGTRRTRREVEFEWVEAQDLVPGDYIVGVRELESTGVRMPLPEEITAMLAAHSPLREVPEWVWGAPKAAQMAFMAGYLMGDGSLSHQAKGQDAWQVGTSSLKMAKQLRALCHYLGLRCSRLTSQDAKRGFDGSMDTQHRFYVYAHEGWFAQIPLTYSCVRDGEVLEGLDKRLVARRVEFSRSSGRVVPTFDITVEEHHNYVAEGMVVHNTAMHRPDWTLEEREAKAELYGSRDHPDYRRNILGLHGDASSALFVLTRLMACVDTNQGSPYNQQEYYSVRINDEKLRDTGMEIGDLLDFPGSHMVYDRVWVGADIGMTNHPTEILIFGEEYKQGSGGQKDGVSNMRLKCIARIHLERISAPDQRAVFERIYEFYRPKAIAIDRTGLGLPIYQEVKLGDNAGLAHCFRGYNFSEKIPVGFEPDEHGNTLYDEDGDPVQIMANVLEFSSDTLRLLVDKQTLQLPWDVDMLREFQGQTYVVTKSATNPYGKKEFNKGKFHALDAARMAVLGYQQEFIDKMLEITVDNEPVLDSFVMY